MDIHPRGASPAGRSCVVLWWPYPEPDFTSYSEPSSALASEGRLPESAPSATPMIYRLPAGPGDKPNHLYIPRPGILAKKYSFRRQDADCRLQAAGNSNSLHNLRRSTFVKDISILSPIQASGYHRDTRRHACNRVLLTAGTCCRSSKPCSPVTTLQQVCPLLIG